MNNKKRTFLIGAGFSKAVAGAPTMVEIWDHFEEIYKKEKNHSRSNNRVDWFNKLDDFVTNIEELAVERFSKKNKNIKEGVRRNLEYLLTLIDIHSLYSADFNFKSKKANIDSYPVIPFKFTNKNELEEIRRIILTYLHITFEQVNGNKLLNKFASIINMTDEIISFNYDILIEKSLWNKNIWSPLKGYIGVSEFIEENYSNDLRESKKISKIKIHKMHGSISWDIPNKIFNNNEIKIKLKNDNQKYYYKGMEEIINRKATFNDKSKSYHGKHLPPWILPSFVKPFNNNQIYKIWKSAFSKLSKTNELVIIGYSFRPEDTNGQLLLATLPSDCKIILVDINDDVKKRLENDLGYEVEKHYYSLKNYLNKFTNSIYKLDE